MEFGILPAARNRGHHLVAITTSWSLLPAAFKATASDASETPLPYNSAVSNQLIPPSSAARTVAFFSSRVMVGKAKPKYPPPPENSIIPKHKGVILMSVLPNARNGATSLVTLVGPFRPSVS